MSSTQAEKAKIIDKIKKLLALSKSDSVGEAAAAAAKAQELMERYSIESAMLCDGMPEQSFQFITKRLWEGNKVPTWMLQLAVGVGGVNRCHVHFRSARRRGNETTTGHISVSGTEESIEKVQLLYGWLVGEVNRLYQEERPGDFDRGSGKRWANSFRLGAVNTISIRLNQAAKRARETMLNGGLDAEEYRKASESNDIEAILRMDSERKSYLPSVVQTALMRLDAEKREATMWATRAYRLAPARNLNTRGTFGDGYARGRQAGHRANLHGPAGHLGAR